MQVKSPRAVTHAHNDPEPQRYEKQKRRQYSQIPKVTRQRNHHKQLTRVDYTTRAPDAWPTRLRIDRRRAVDINHAPETSAGDELFAWITRKTFYRHIFDPGIAE
jgi:hypothetical protein